MQNARFEELLQLLFTAAKQLLPVLQTLKRLYSPVVEYGTCRLASRSTRYDETVLSYNSRIVKKVKSH